MSSRFMLVRVCNSQSTGDPGLAEDVRVVEAEWIEWCAKRYERVTTPNRTVIMCGLLCCSTRRLRRFRGARRTVLCRDYRSGARDPPSRRSAPAHSQPRRTIDLTGVVRRALTNRIAPLGGPTQVVGGSIRSMVATRSIERSNDTTTPIPVDSAQATT